jgi:hypothetical protein
VAAHGRKRVAHGLEIGLVAALGSQARGRRLHHGAQFEQVAHELQVRLPGKGPGQHFGIEQVPAVARQHARTGLGAAGHQALGGEHLDRLAIGAARDFQFFGKGDFARKNIARLVLAREDRRAQLVGNGAVQPPSRPARISFALVRAFPFHAFVRELPFCHCLCRLLGHFVSRARPATKRLLLRLSPEYVGVNMEIPMTEFRSIDARTGAARPPLPCTDWTTWPGSAPPPKRRSISIAPPDGRSARRSWSGSPRKSWPSAIR